MSTTKKRLKNIESIILLICIYQKCIQDLKSNFQNFESLRDHGKTLRSCSGHLYVDYTF